MATIDDAAEIAEALPEVTVGARYGHRTWLVRDKFFVWDRPFSKADIKRFGDAPPPDGDILGVKVDDLADKEAVLTATDDSVFTIPHFDGFPAVLVHLRTVDPAVLEELVIDAWLACAPEKLAAAYLEAQGSER